MSTSLHYRPAPPLDSFVSTIWYYAGYHQPHALERILPDGTLGFVVNLDDDQIRVYDRQDPSRCSSFAGAVITGARAEHFIIDTAEQHCVLGVQFRPGGAWPFLEAPADQLQGAHVPIGGGLRERILEARTPVARCRAMESILLDRARGRLELRPDIDAAIRKCEANSRPEEFLARRFTERFRATVGLTPKTFARVRRFQSALRKISKGGDPDWLEIALSCGYYDQAHFNHDFRAFSGINPTTYLAKRSPHLNHVPL